jgi:beta-phosphoglucomutase-like phosphatase (HAD superfamily)
LIHVPDYIKGLIFDCDGTLVDSMPPHMEAWEHAIHRSGAKYDREFFFSKKEMRETEIIDLYDARFNTTLRRKDVVAAKDQFFRKHISRVKPVRTVVDIVHRDEAGLPMAVVSGGVREFVVKELRVIGISKNFEVILTADDPFKPTP